MTGRFNLAIVSFLAGCHSRERLRLIDAHPSMAQAHILVWPNKTLECGKSGMTVLSTKIRRVLCSAKESSVLGKRIDGAKRKQSIYSQKSLNCYAVEGSNMGPKHSKIIVFITWGSRNFLSVAFLSLWIHLEKHSRVRRIPKRSLLFR